MMMVELDRLMELDEQPPRVHFAVRRRKKNGSFTWLSSGIMETWGPRRKCKLYQSPTVAKSRASRVERGKGAEMIAMVEFPIIPLQ